MHVRITEKSVNNIVAYLLARPYQEVAHLFAQENDTIYLRGCSPCPEDSKALGAEEDKKEEPAKADNSEE